MTTQALTTGKRPVSITEAASVPAMIETAGRRAKKRFVEFFTAEIDNDNTRAAYLHSVRLFCQWCERRKIELTAVEPTLVALYREELGKSYGKASIKQHLAGISMLFDHLVTGGIIQFNPVASVKRPKLVITKGKTPVLVAEDARTLIDSIDVAKIAGLRDRALIGVMIYSFARVGATLKMDVEDVYRNNRRYWIRLHEKGGKYHEMPLHHNAEKYLLEYMEAAGLHRGTPLFRTLSRKRQLTESRMLREDAWKMIRRRARKAGVTAEICSHTMRATGITEYMRNGGTLERAQQMAAHASSRTTSLYDRTSDAVDLDEVERVMI